MRSPRYLNGGTLSPFPAEAKHFFLLVLSVAKYYSPEGKSIQDNAVTPEDLVLEPEPSAGDQGDDDADATPQITASDKPNEDSILKKAIEVAQKRS